MPFPRSSTTSSTSVMSATSSQASLPPAWSLRSTLPLPLPPALPQPRFFASARRRPGPACGPEPGPLKPESEQLLQSSASPSAKVPRLRLLPSFASPALLLQLLLLLLLLLLLAAPTSAFEEVDEPEDGQVRILPLYGDFNSDGHKSVEVQIGNPPQTLRLVLSLDDEGLVVPCNCDAACKARLESYGPYDPTSSKTSEALGCSAEQCPDRRGWCQNGHCRYERVCEECSSKNSKVPHAFGEWMRDHVHIPDLIPDGAPAQMLEFPCDEQRSFKPGFSGRWNGIFGLHPSNNLLQKLLPSSQDTHAGSSPHQTNKKQKNKQQEKKQGEEKQGEEKTELQKKAKNGVGKSKAAPAPFFSLCFAPEGGLLTLNGFNEQRHSSPMVGLPLLKQPGISYTVLLSSIHLGNEQLKGPTRHATVKVGEPFSIFPAKLYEAFVKALDDACASENRCQAQHLGNSCWRLPFPADPAGQFPPLILHMGESNSRVEWLADAFLRQLGMTSTWCLAIVEGTGNEVILGDSWMLNREVVFDSWQEQLWVAPANCSSPRPKPTVTETTTSTTMGSINPFSFPGSKFDKFGLSNGFLPPLPGRGAPRPPGLGAVQGNGTKTTTSKGPHSKLFPTGAFSVAISLASFMCIWSCATPRVRQVVGQQRRRIGFESDFLDELFGRELGPVPEDPGEALQPPARPPRRGTTPLTTARNEESAAEEQE